MASVVFVGAAQRKALVSPRVGETCGFGDPYEGMSHPIHSVYEKDEATVGAAQRKALVSPRVGETCGFGDPYEGMEGENNL